MRHIRNIREFVVNYIRGKQTFKFLQAYRDLKYGFLTQIPFHYFIKFLGVFKQNKIAIS